ncbi:MAG: ABC transporter permease [Granulosicoccus sp.]
MIASLLGKDFREHASAGLLLGGGCILVFFALLAQNSVAAYSMSSFEIVRFALLGFFPLITLIIGNRLIVREYLSGTRLFVEALPVGINQPLILKYLLGFSFLALMVMLMILLAAQQAGLADDVTTGYVLLIFAKTLVVVLLYWSIAFCFSLCGHLRLMLYLLLAVVVGFLMFFPGVDSSRLGPFALLEDDRFIYERDSIPWFDMISTLVLSAVFTAAGFLLTRLGDGSVLERLAKPMTRRDYVALGVLAAAGLVVTFTLLENKQQESIDFSSQHVVRLYDPDVYVLYLEPDNELVARKIAQRISESVSQLQATLGFQNLPIVRLALATSRDRNEFDYATSDGVFVAANWLDNDSYDDAVLDTVLMHGVLSTITNARAVFEPYHWVLDGFTRWWVEQGVQPLRQGHRDELITRALVAMDREASPVDLIRKWQLLADRHSYPSAESLAWAALTYLEQEHGREVVIQLAREFLATPLATTALASLADRIDPVEQRIESVVGVSLEAFNDGWRGWLNQQRTDVGVKYLLDKIPPLSGEVFTRTSESGVHEMSAGYTLLPGGSLDSLQTIEGRCFLKHDYIGPFDTEFDVADDYEIVAECQVGPDVHTIESVYAPGDRVFVALDFESPDFHQPVRLHAQRIYIP